MDNYKRLQVLRNKWTDCTECDLHTTRKNVVFGSGNPDADILIVGEAPGEEEDETGLPFVGKIGKSLEVFLDAAQLDRKVDLFLTNVIACRSTMVVEDKYTSKKSVENRNPSKLERSKCLPRLNQIIYTLDPLLIVTLGKVAFQALTGKPTPIEKCRGKLHTMVFNGKYTDIRYPVLPLYHPVYLDSSYNYEPTGPWTKTAEDFRLICEIIDRLRKEYKGINPQNRSGEGTMKEDEDEE